MTASPPIVVASPDESTIHRRLHQAQMMRCLIALGSAGLLALAICVHGGLLDTFDSMVRQWARPDDVWGTAQLRADLVVEGLRPAYSLPFWRRSRSHTV